MRSRRKPISSTAQTGWLAWRPLGSRTTPTPRIFAFTEGIPRRINLVCNRVRLAGFLNEKHVLVAADVETVAKEMTDELGVVGRPGEPADKFREGQNLISKWGKWSSCRSSGMRRSKEWSMVQSQEAAYRPMRPICSAASLDWRRR